MKPICTGDHDDVRQLLEACGSCEPEHLVNPVWFRTPVAPYTASIIEDRLIDLAAIRHAFEQLGNLLGRDQSGHIAAIGYDLYVQMVSEAVSELKGEPRPRPLELSVDLPDAAHLPPDYVEAEDVRLEASRRITGLRTDIDNAQAKIESAFYAYVAVVMLAGALVAARMRNTNLTSLMGDD